MKSADYWLGKLSKMRVDRASGDPAPHKPLLLLVVLDLAQDGLLPPKTLALTPDLASRFMSYSTVVANRRPQRPDVVTYRMSGGPDRSDFQSSRSFRASPRSSAGT